MKMSSTQSNRLPNRREFFKTTGAGLLGVSGLLSLPSEAFAPKRRAEACILIWLSGGLSHLDTFDPKLDAPREIRGPFAFRESSIKDVWVNHDLPRMSELLERTTLIRTLGHDETNHDRASHYGLTGCKPTQALSSPSLSSVVADAYGVRNGKSAEIIIASSLDGSSAATFVKRLSPSTSVMETQPDLKTACLRARQWIESGARFVTVVDEGWDLHDDLHAQYQAKKLPELDRAYSALMTDLEHCGLLNETLVVLMGEFGRSPKINAFGGRDHWPSAGCAILAGGPIQPGVVIGETDAIGAYPILTPVSPENLAEMILNAMGVRIIEVKNVV